ncbi:MAG TPA: hypothetical protein VKY73_15810 [Polyangiaceae bacterium]|nr:hypothetical protein [Polyangiaceae bacterium]
MAGQGELEKLRITAYKDAEFTEAVPDGEFTAQVNPEKVSFKYQIETEDEQAQGTSGAQPRFGKTKPEELTFEFLFDATGAIPLPDGSSSISDNGVVDRLDKFKKVVLEYDGEQHKPNNLIVAWGRILFKCVLVELNLEYRLFRPDGTPIRAAATARFQGYIEDTLRVAKENSTSPDITHTRVVKDGDTLLQLTHEIYGDPSYYLKVAAVNGLTNFRKLTTGMVLRFPPLEKAGHG